MYLSRVEIDLKNRRKTYDLSHLGAYHNWVESCFPRYQDENNRPRNLWRIDVLNGRSYLLLLSTQKPNLEELSKYGVSGTAVTKEYDDFLNKLYLGEILRFCLTANPSRKISVPGQRQGRIMPHITIAQQKKWFLDRTDVNGFKVLEDQENYPQFDIVNREWKLLRHKGSGTARLSCVTFEGVLKITDLEKFKKAMIKGIGREKAYGMGLLTVIPM